MGRGDSNTSTATAPSRSQQAGPSDTFTSGRTNGFLGDLRTAADQQWHTEHLRQRVIQSSIYKQGTLRQLEKQSEAVAWAWQNGASEEELRELSGLSSEEVRDMVYSVIRSEAEAEVYENLRYYDA